MPPKEGVRRGYRPRRGASQSQTRGPQSDANNQPEPSIVPPPPNATNTTTTTTTSADAHTTTPTPGPSSRAGTARDGSSASAAKFRPRGNRRSEAERGRIAQEQQKIQSKKIADEARQQRSRGRLRRAGRSRGGFRDRGGASFAASGPLAGGVVSAGSGFGTHGSGRGGRGGGGSGGSGGGSGGFRGKTDGAYGGGSVLSFAAGREHGDRINIDELCGPPNDPEQENGSNAKVLTTRGTRPMMPVGIRREEAQDKGIKVATSAEIEGQEKGLQGDEEEEDSSEDMWIDNSDARDGQTAEIEGDEGGWDHAAPRPQRKVQIKTEDGAVVETMEIDEIAAHQQPKEPPPPETKKAGVAASDPRTQRHKPRKAKQQDAEEERFSQDLDQLLGLLAIGADQREKTEGEVAQPQSTLEGNMFLFQFPPVLPPLGKTATSSSRDTIKSEPNDDVVMLDQPARSTLAEVDLTAEGTERIKAEEDAEEVQETPNPYKDGGFVGQLVMRKSGKVELSWGGQTLELVPGTQAQFLNTAVLLEENDAKAQPGQVAGTAFGMGKIEGKFILAPKWGEEDEWEVDDEDLVAP